MDGLGLYVLFNSSSVISGQWKGEHKTKKSQKIFMQSVQLNITLGELLVKTKPVFTINDLDYDVCLTWEFDGFQKHKVNRV